MQGITTMTKEGQCRTRKVITVKTMGAWNMKSKTEHKGHVKYPEDWS